MTTHILSTEGHLEAARNLAWKESTPSSIIAELLTRQLTTMKRPVESRERRAVAAIVPDGHLHGAWHTLNALRGRVPNKQEVEQKLREMLQPYVDKGLLPDLQIESWWNNGKLRFSISISNAELSTPDPAN